jgi:RND family efflux transporter MFP subunit
MVRAQQRPPAPVVVAPVVERKVAAGQTFVGTVQPLRRSIVGTAVAGRVIEFFVNEGDRVKKDQPLAQLRLDALQIQRAAALAELELRKQELAEMQNGSRPEEIDQAKARAAGAKALMEYRQSRLKRIQELIEKRAASTDEFQDASSAAEQAVAAFLDARKAYELAVAGPRKEKISQAKSRVDAGTEAVNQIDDQIRKHTIVSPFDGYVVAENTEVGQWISQADPVAEVIEVDQVEIAIPLLEDYVTNLKVGQKVRVELGALNAKTLEGKVALIVPQADVKSRTFPVKVRVHNEFVDDRPLIKPGMLARVTLPVGRESTALLVPKDAIVLGGPTPIVYAVTPGKDRNSPGIARLVPVQLGIVEDDLIQVKGELKPGELVVYQGNERLMPGAPVTILPEPASRQAAAD